MWSHVTISVLLLVVRGPPGSPAVGQRQPGDIHSIEDKDWREILSEAIAQENEEVIHPDTSVFSGKLEVVEDWPVNDLELGQIGGIGTDKEGYLHVFHRADRTWNANSFNENNTFAKLSEGPIKQPTVYTINGSNGVILNKWADNFFYLPHGLTVDKLGNFWMTDVAMHQVFKFEPGKKTPSLTLGKAFQPAVNNEDVERFCKPTDVVVDSNGDFFVSDGYCASRVLKFDKLGHLIGQFGVDDSQIPHSLALAEDLDLICVADRENMRVLCYNAGRKDGSLLGEPEREYNDDTLGRVFAITYSETDGLLYGVTGPTGILVPQGFTIDLREDERYTRDIIATWSPDDKGFDQPHDVAVSSNGETVYVGEIKPDLIWKFVKEQN